ncbi:MAG: ATP-binding cassette domain-containing protein, partial [Alphaproteobacteria bacterium]|nr:ATP-binding cassette domain-containing protein [Alphaproteobacteria bacterium]
MTPHGPDAAAALTADTVGHVFGQAAGASGVRALDRVSLELGTGEFFSVIGPSGCGKSTFLDIVAGLLAPT